MNDENKTEGAPAEIVVEAAEAPESGAKPATTRAMQPALDKAAESKAMEKGIQTNRNRGVARLWSQEEGIQRYLRSVQGF